MTPIAYVALVEARGPREFLVSFPDVPQAQTRGNDQAEALANARDALDAAIEHYVRHGLDLPARSRIGVEDHQHFEIAVEPQLAARALLVGAMKTDGLSRLALAERMNRSEWVVQQILTGQGASLDLILEALRVVGLRPALAA